MWDTQLLIIPLKSSLVVASHLHCGLPVGSSLETFQLKLWGHFSCNKVRPRDVW